MRSKTIDSIVADLDRGGINPAALDYMRTAAVRWVAQCRTQAGTILLTPPIWCLQDCADCEYYHYTEE